MPLDTKIEDRPWLDSSIEPFIKIQNVTKKFGAFTAVDRIDLNVYQGELFSLLGGSGCGKTTLLRMLAGFEEVTSGHIFIDGQDMAGIPPYERPVNMMFQSYALFPHMTVEKNVAYGLKRDGVPKLEIASRVTEILDMVELGQFASRKPHQLSGGQRQRVALARALVKKPKLLLLDEPLGALDKRLREQTQFELMDLQEQLGITFMVVTHDQEEAMTLSTRIAVMDQGDIIQIGTPTEIYEYPESRFTAGFIGNVNMFEGRVTNNSADHVTVQGTDGTEFYIDHGQNVKEGQKVWVAVRPEKLVINKDAVAAGPNQLLGTVDDIGYMGNHSIYRVKLASGRIVQTTAQNIVRPKDAEWAVDWDDKVTLTWEPSATVLLTK
ncbi:ABC transporter ATP-binding protein [Curvivirga aplysinae]|uniref:ABC transporter ATP-binding protein n=1 Tax=Curvivirga aplysinae TaxID=2529852 RepID=UPI002E270BF0